MYLVIPTPSNHLSPEKTPKELSQDFVNDRLAHWQKLSENNNCATNFMFMIYQDLRFLNAFGTGIAISPRNREIIKNIIAKGLRTNQNPENALFGGPALGEIRQIDPALADNIFEKNGVNILGSVLINYLACQRKNPLPAQYFRGMQPKWVDEMLKKSNIPLSQILHSLNDKIEEELGRKKFPKNLLSDFVCFLNFQRQLKEGFESSLAKYHVAIEAAFEAFALEPSSEMAPDLRELAPYCQNLIPQKTAPHLEEKIKAAQPNFNWDQHEKFAEARQNFTHYFPKLKLNSPPRTDISEIMPPPKNNGNFSDFVRQIYQHCLFNFSQTKSDLQQLLDFLDSARAGQLMISNNKNLAIDISTLLESVANSDKHHLFSGAEFQKFWQDLLSVLVSKKFFSNCSAADFENILKYFKHCQIKSPIDSQETEKQTLQIFTEEAQNMLRRGDENSFSILFNALLENWKTILPNFCTQMQNFLENPNPKNLIQVSPEVRKFAQEKIKLLNP